MTIKTYHEIISDAIIASQLPNSSWGTAAGGGASSSSSSTSAATTISSNSCSADSVSSSQVLASSHHHHYYKYECEDRSRLLVILRWFASKLHHLRVWMSMYSSNPVFLVLVPLVVGLSIGYFIGRHHTNFLSESSSSLEEEEDGEEEEVKGGVKDNTKDQSYYVRGRQDRTDQQSSSSSKSAPSSFTFLHKVVQTASLLQSLINEFYYLILYPKISGLFQGSSHIQDDDDDEVINNGKEQLKSTLNDPVESEIQQNKDHNENDDNTLEDDEERDEKTRKYLKSDVHTKQESGIDTTTTTSNNNSNIPQHIAVIMDGNRRYGRDKYNSTTKGHWDGSKTLVDFSKWCIAEGVKVLTVYAFSTENWNRSPSEVNALMKIFCKYCDELRVEALERGIRLKVLSTETDQIPQDVAQGLKRMVDETKHCTKFLLNICLSYGSRGEIVNACKSITSDVLDGNTNLNDISEQTISQQLLTGHCSDPDVVIRTSGEFRISNFLLWQLAYSEMFFLEKRWPELTKEDLLSVIRTYAKERKRRFGK